MSEIFSWGRFFSGLVDPTAYWKTLAIVIRIAIVALVVIVIYIVGVALHNKLSPKKQQPAIFTVTGQQGGCVKNSADQKENKFGILNF